MPTIIESSLTAFQEQQQIPNDNFGAICTMIFVTCQARRYGLPLTREFLTSQYGGQVAGLHRNAIAAILADYNVPHGFLGEAGRTNASSLRHAIASLRYVSQLLGGH